MAPRRRTPRPGHQRRAAGRREALTDLDPGAVLRVDPVHHPVDEEELRSGTPRLGARLVRDGQVAARRLTDAMTGLTTQRLGDGSTVYGGSVAAGLVARESGFKEGESLRLLPFGYVAHGEADDPSAVIEAAVTVGADGVVRLVTATWGVWRYEVAYSELGTTPAPKAPAGARPLLRDR